VQNVADPIVEIATVKPDNATVLTDGPEEHVAAKTEKSEPPFITAPPKRTATRSPEIPLPIPHQKCGLLPSVFLAPL